MKVALNNFYINIYMKPKILVFTGGCYSGKTTSMTIIKELLENQGKSVIFLDELIRKYNIESIDKIRKDANKYMDLQYDIISGKIQAELKSYYSNYDIILVDRSVTDSLFYLTFYVDKNNLDNEHQQKFIKLFHSLNDYLDKVNNIYTYIFEFSPIQNLVEQDKFRPNNLKELQQIEYEMIKKYNQLYFNNHNGYMTIDLNEISLDQMKDFWNNKIKELKL